MAIVSNNIVTKGLKGKVGNLIFRKRGNKTTAYVMSKRKVPLSEKQKEVHIRFAAAVANAKNALLTVEGQKRFEDLAIKEGKESAYSAAVAYFMHQEK